MLGNASLSDKRRTGWKPTTTMTVHIISIFLLCDWSAASQGSKWTIPHPSKAVEVCQEKILTQNRWSIICLQLQRMNLLVKWESVMHQYSNLSRTTVVILYEKNSLREVFLFLSTCCCKAWLNRNNKGKLIRHFRIMSCAINALSPYAF